MITRVPAVAALISALILAAMLAACTGDDDGNGSGGDPTPPSGVPTPSEAPRDPAAAMEVMTSFTRAVTEDRLDDAWFIYAASVSGNISEHRADRGCEYGAFAYEFPKIRNLFSRAAPFEVVETHGSALGVTVVELTLRSADDKHYLATLARSDSAGPYQLMFLNSGRPAVVPGVADPLPPPEDPQGLCGIWSGPR